MGKKLVTKSELLKAIRKIGANHTAIGRSLGITRQAVAKRIESDGDLKKAYEDQRERILDEAENQLAKAVRKGTGWAVRFVLSTLGKSRGYAKSSSYRAMSEAKAKSFYIFRITGETMTIAKTPSFFGTHTMLARAMELQATSIQTMVAGAIVRPETQLRIQTKGGISTMGKENAREAKLRLMFQEMALGIREVPPELEELYRTKNIGRSFASRSRFALDYTAVLVATWKKIEND